MTWRNRPVFDQLLLAGAATLMLWTASVSCSCWELYTQVIRNVETRFNPRRPWRVSVFLSWTEPLGQPSKSWFLEASYVSSGGSSDISWSRKIICVLEKEDRFAEQLQVLECVLAAYTPQRRPLRFTHAVASLFQGLPLTCSGIKGLISSFHSQRWRQAALFLLYDSVTQHTTV